MVIFHWRVHAQENNSKSYPLTSGDIRHGQNQIEQMLRDRPQMKKYATKGDSVWSWTVHELAGASIGNRIFWNPGSPHNFEKGIATNHYPLPGKRSEIRLSKTMNGQPIPGELLWTAAIFELHNIQSGTKYYSLYKKAKAGKINCSQWIRENSKLEYRNLQRTRDFYFKVWSPHIRHRRVSTDPRFWRAEMPKSFESWFTTKDADTFKNYWRDAFPKPSKGSKAID